MIDYIKLNHFYLFKQFILLFKFQGFVSTYIPTYIMKYTNNCKCMYVGYTETISGRKMGKCKLVQFNYYTVKIVLNYLALTYEWRGIAYRMRDVHLHKVVVLCSDQADHFQHPTVVCHLHTYSYSSSRLGILLPSYQHLYYIFLLSFHGIKPKPRPLTMECT